MLLIFTRMGLAQSTPDRIYPTVTVVDEDKNVIVEMIHTFSFNVPILKASLIDVSVRANAWGVLMHSCSNFSFVNEYLTLSLLQVTMTQQYRGYADGKLGPGSCFNSPLMIQITPDAAPTTNDNLRNRVMGILHENLMSVRVGPGKLCNPYYSVSVRHVQQPYHIRVVSVTTLFPFDPDLRG